MQRRLLSIILILVLISPVVSSGQTPDEGLPGGSVLADRSMLQSSKFSRSSLLDPSKMSMEQSYTMTMSSGGYNNGMNGLYMNTLSYRVSPNALLRVHMGIQHQMMSFGDDNRTTSPTRLVPGFDLTYRPSKNTVLQVSYGTSDFYLNSRYRSLGQFGRTDGLFTTQRTPDPMDWNENH